MRITRPLEDYCLLSKVNTLMGVDKQDGTYLPQGQAPRFPHGWLKIFGSPRYPTMIEWTIGGRMHWKSSARKVHHMSTIPALANLPLEFLWDPD